MGKKHDKPLHLDMPFEEALGRLTQTDAAELETSSTIKRKAKRAPGAIVAADEKRKPTPTQRR